MTIYFGHEIASREKFELLQIIKNTPKEVKELHKWVLSDGSSSLDYIPACSRDKFDDYGHKLITRESMSVIDLWILFAITKQHLPTTAEFIDIVNEFALSLDIIYEKKNAS
ncbi:hypothetical protein POP12_029 [Pectobacterium phage POP12]|nr:hypothetical protein POP12_029 [Pectobacterium phage POP12]